jgi:hypothetical protein
MAKHSGPTEAQLQAAIEGAKDMSESGRGAGRVAGPGESLISPVDEIEPVDPGEAVKRETALFIPGTHGKKPQL